MALEINSFTKLKKNEVKFFYVQSRKPIKEFGLTFCNILSIHVCHASTQEVVCMSLRVILSSTLKPRIIVSGPVSV